MTSQMQVQRLSEMDEASLEQLVQRNRVDPDALIGAIGEIEEFRKDPAGTVGRANFKAHRQAGMRVSIEEMARAQVPEADLLVMERMYRRMLDRGKEEKWRLLTHTVTETGAGRPALEEIRREGTAQYTTLDASALTRVPGIDADRSLSKLDYVPLRRVGAYVPSSLPSTLLTIAANARAAGVEQIAVCTKPEADGSINPAIIAACKVAGIDELYAIGSAKAGVMALGLGVPGEIAKVEKIVGPCSPFVDTTKQLLSSYGVAVDMPANASELAVLVDASQDNRAFLGAETLERRLAYDLLAQAEHSHDDKRGPTRYMLLTNSELLARRVLDEIDRYPDESAKRKFYAGGAVIYDPDIKKLAGLCGRYDPEVTEVWAGYRADAIARELPCGKIYTNTPSVFGDYGFVGSGCNDPTNGVKTSGISVMQFMRRREINKAQLGDGARRCVARMADIERLPAHAASARYGMKTEG